MSARILIVEDERLVAEDIRLSIEAFGYNVCDVVGTGELAIERCRQLLPDLALMDVRLKGRLNGIEAAQRICQKNDIAIVFLTAFSDAQFLQQAQTVLPYGYLLKPYNEKELQATIQIALHKHGIEKQLRAQQQQLNAILNRLNESMPPGQEAPLPSKPAADKPAQLSRCSGARKPQLEGLLHTLTHELRAPLIASRLTLGSLIRGAFGPVDQKLEQVLNESAEANEELLRLVETLLEIARYEAGKQVLLREALSWEMLLAKAVKPLQAIFQSDLRHIRSQIEPLPVLATGDPQQIIYVLQSLLDNALRASGPGDFVDVKVEFVRPNQVRVSITDQGQGIVPSLQKQLFKKFLANRGRGWGAGLSLYLCNQIVQAHGGRIAVHSAPSLGSTFFFTLPLPA